MSNVGRKSVLSSRRNRLFVRRFRSSKRGSKYVPDEDESIFKEFLTRTSLRALPRASKSVSKQGKTFWFAVFLLLSTSFLVCIGKAIETYLEYKTKFNQQMENQLYPFPSVTICPHRPFSNKGEHLMISAMQLTPLSFIKHYEAWKKLYSQRNNISNPESVPIKYPTMNHFIQLFSTHNITQFTPHVGELILNCRLNKGTKSGTIDSDLWEECDFDNYSSYWKLFDDRFVLCYTFNFKESIRKTANGLKLILFLENYLIVDAKDNERSAQFLQKCQQCMPKTAETWRQGAVITIHEPNTKPQIKRVGIDLSPGSVNHIVFDATITHFDKTYKKCIQREDFNNCTESNGQCFEYTVDLCEQKKLQDYIREECKCVESSLPITSMEYNSSPEYCEVWDFDEMMRNENYERKMIEKAECLNSVKRRIDFKELNHPCHVLCNDITYKTKLSSTIGFHKTILDYLYEEILKRHHQNIHIFYPELFRQAVANNDSIKAAQELLGSKDFHDSFIVVNINRKSFSPTVRREIIAFPIQILLSLIGGFASLFMGFTVFVFFEIGELFVKLGSQFIKRYRLVENKNRNELEYF